MDAFDLIPEDDKWDALSAALDAARDLLRERGYPIDVLEACQILDDRLGEYAARLEASLAHERVN